MNKECSTCVFGNNLKLKENTTYCDLWELEFASNDRCTSYYARKEAENETD